MFVCFLRKFKVNEKKKKNLNLTILLTLELNILSFFIVPFFFGGVL